MPAGWQFSARRLFYDQALVDKLFYRPAIDPARGAESFRLLIRAATGTQHHLFVLTPEQIESDVIADGVQEPIGVDVQRVLIIPGQGAGKKRG